MSNRSFMYFYIVSLCCFSRSKSSYSLLDSSIAALSFYCSFYIILLSLARSRSIWSALFLDYSVVFPISFSALSIISFSFFSLYVFVIYLVFLES
jgi:hypothetical protein